ARHPDDGVAAAAGVRLLALDRPGYGASDPAADLTLWSFADDLGAFLDELDIGRVRLLGWSAGGPWALAAAAVLGPERVDRVTTFGCVAPLAAFDVEDDGDPEVVAASGGRADVAAMVLAGEGTPAAVAEEMARWLLPTPPVSLELALETVEEQVSKRSRRDLEAVPGAIEALAASLAAAVDRHTDAGFRRDVEVQFSPAEIELLVGARCPVRLVHGSADSICGPAVGRWLAARLADATVEVWEGEGHHALFPRWSELLR
nr:alpha/beta fold hydrolase [Acidimicrobiia bacterium]